MIRTADAKPRVTLDTNLLVYAVDQSAGDRHQTAAQIILRVARADCVLTLQSISEFYVVASRKRIMPKAAVAAQAEDWLGIFRCVPPTAGALRAALNLANTGQASYWDALLVATAAEAGCSLIFTEDMADGAWLAGIEIHNPFTADGGLTERTRQLLDL
jgi:predicted nucleic acid-binding protein